MSAMLVPNAFLHCVFAGRRIQLRSLSSIYCSSVFLLLDKILEKRPAPVPNSVDVIGKIFTAALDHLGTPNTVRALCSLLTEQYGTCSILLYGLKPDSTLQLVESFGFAETIQEKFRSASLFDPLPVSDSMRQGTTARFSAAELVEKYPAARELDLPHEVFYVVPCTSSGSPVGGLIAGLFTLKNGEELPSIVLQALQVAAFHVLIRQPDLVEVV